MSDVLKNVEHVENSEQQSQKALDAAKQSEAGQMIVFDLRTLTHFRDEGPYIQVLSDTGAARMVLFAFKAGQQLKEHHTSSQILVQVLRGRITFSVGGQSVKLQAGMLLQVEAAVPHSVLAQSNAIMLLTMTPSPAHHTLGLDRVSAQELPPLVKRTY
jgi:quercetin dioxygenase-like cupin family protein